MNLPSTVSQTGVVIVNRNTRDCLRTCVASVSRECPKGIVVVDCASTDGSVAMIRTEFPEVVLASLGNNPGYGAAMNLGVCRLATPFVLMLNSDAYVVTGALAAMETYLHLHPCVGLVGPRLYNSNGTLQPSARRFPGTAAWLLDNNVWGDCLRHAPGIRNVLLNSWPHDHARQIPWVVGAAMTVRTSAFNATGGFDESYFMYFEEVDLCERMQSVGWEVHFTPSAEVIHIGGASTRKCRAEMERHYIESAVRFFSRRYSPVRARCLGRLLRMERRLRGWLAPVGPESSDHHARAAGV